MKVIIPAKRSSTRVPDKNWRPFYNDLNLVEIKIVQLLKAVAPADVFLSTDDISKQSIADKHGIGFLLRKAGLASDDTPWPDALYGIINDTPFGLEEDIAWVEVINPLFDDFAGMLAKWNEVKATHDSIVLAAPLNKFLLTGKGVPVNFQFGKWHAMSQNMEPLFAWDSACIMRKKDLLYYSYPIGRTPFIYTTDGPCVDIDTMDDFELAQYFYAKKYTHANK
jgi:CMP-N-acetylneuraminic acid synthetase